MKRITQFDGLYGEVAAQPYAAGVPATADQHHRPNGEYLFSELLETRSHTFDWVIQPHIHARLFQVFFIESGGVEFAEAAQKRQLTGPVVLLIPSTALHGLVYTPDAKGRILTLSDTLLHTLFPPTSALMPMLGSVQCIQTFDEPYSAQAVGQLIAGVDEELFGDQPEKRTMLQLDLQRLFIGLYRLWRQHETAQNNPNSPAIGHFRKFQQRVRQVGTTLSITQLADELAITPVHLNRICQAIAGQSASQLVQEHILNEARKYLTYTSYSVSEVAYLLHFDYPNYFAKFFKKHTGLSPTEFREQQSSG